MQTLRIFFLFVLFLSVPIAMPSLSFAAKNAQYRPLHPITPPSKPLSMGEAVRFALQANPGLGAYAAQARSSEEARKAARGEFGPKLGVVYSAMKQVKKSEPTPAKTAERGNYSFGVEISQTLFRGFRLLATYQKAALQAESDRLALKKARLETIESVQACFIALLRASANVTSQKESLDRLADQLAITKAFYSTGLKPKLDVLQAEVDLREAESVLLQIENNRDTQLTQLNTLLGLSPTKTTAIKGTLAYRAFSPTLEQCLERAYRQRPDIVMAALAVDIAGKDRQTVQSGYYPHIEGYYNVTNAGNTPDLKMAGENGSRSSSWEVGVKASWDVFQWGTTYYADQKAAEIVTKMRYEEQSLRLQVGSDVKTKYLAVREAEKRIAVAKATLASADEAYRAALARYREQVGTGFDVLDTSAKLTAAKFSLSSAYADYLSALSKLFTAMGEEHPDLLS